MRIMITLINFDVIRPVWQVYLWPNRVSAIESHSAMIYKSNDYSMTNFQLPVEFFAIIIDDKIIGVNSCHMCSDGLARSRGLWVHSNFRGKGYGKMLLEETINFGVKQKAKGIWSFPRKTSWETYKSIGFNLTSEWIETETSEANAYCYLEL